MILIVYKKSLHLPFLRRRKRFSMGALREMKVSSRTHQRTLRRVLKVVRGKKINFKAVVNPSGIDASQFDLILSVGGDGTFLEAARGATHQPILGVNSAPFYSVGSFCAANGRNFKSILEKVLAGKGRVVRLNRFNIILNRKRLPAPVLNEVLITHRKPSAMSRYRLNINGIQEKQRSSGLWISTAAGSTGALHSAGGRPLPRTSRALQYRPRELYQRTGTRYRLKGGVLPAAARVEVGSLMEQGLLCLDGDQLTFPFQFGDEIRIEISRFPLRVIEAAE